MTHFTVGVIVPENRLPDIERYLIEQMSPYDEDLEVESYVGYTLEQAAEDLTRDITRLEQILRNADPEFDRARCEELLVKLRAITPEQRYQERIQHYERFNEDGEPLTTYNPDSKWDWWVIGGRWDGWLFDRDAEGEQIADNMTTTEDALARGKVPHAIISPDGTWHEHGTLGWWAVMVTENENWDTESRQLLARYPGHRIVLLDAHI